jgi:hypothetical protein
MCGDPQRGETMTDRNRRTLLKGLSAGAASASGMALLTDTTSAEARNESVKHSQEFNINLDRLRTGHYEQDGEFEEKSEFEFSADPRTGFDVKFELSDVRPAPNDDVRLVYTVVLSDPIVDRLQVNTNTMVKENATGGSMEFVWHGTPVGVNRLFNTGNWMENTHSVTGVVMNDGDAGVVDSYPTSIDPP